jgi:hypothetical protein
MCIPLMREAETLKKKGRNARNPSITVRMCAQHWIGCFLRLGSDFHLVTGYKLPQENCS